MSRIREGFALAKVSWAVIRADRSLLLFPVVALACSVLVAAVFFGVGAGVGAAADSRWVAAPFVAVGLYGLIVIGQFAAVALAACTTASLDGADTTFGQGVAAARGRIGIILQWSAIQLVVGSLLLALHMVLRDAAGRVVSSIVGGLANASWSVATFFVVPMIALEGVGPREAIKRSTGVIREHWGEGVTGSATIGGAVFLLGVLPGIALLALGIALASSTAAVGAVVIALGVLVVLVATLLQMALSAVFRVALYRFATRGDAPGRFTLNELNAAFAPNKRRRGSPQV